MHRNRRLSAPAKWLVLVALVGAVAYSAFPVMEVGDPDSGHWVVSPINDCGASSICVEWQYTVNGQPVSEEACCVPPSYVGTNVYHVCAPEFRHEPH